MLDSDEAVAKTLDTFESKFANDPLRDKYFALGQKVKGRVNSTEDAMFWVGVGVDVYNLMVDEKNLVPGSYKRKEFIDRRSTRSNCRTCPTSSTGRTSSCRSTGSSSSCARLPERKVKGAATPTMPFPRTFSRETSA